MATTTETGREAAQGSFLSIDLGCLVFIQCKGQKERFKSRLVGHLPGAYLIVSTPNVPGIRSLLAAKESILVRYIHQGEAFGFKSDVIGSITAPFPLTFLACPARIERINLRKAMRVDCLIPATLNAEDRSLEGMILDISTAGCRFCVKDPTEGAKLDPIAVDTRVSLWFPLLGQQGQVTVQGQVKNLRQEEDRLTLGIFFSNPDRELLRRIAGFVQEAAGYL